MPIPKLTKAATIANLKSTLRGNMTVHSCVATTSIRILGRDHNHTFGSNIRERMVSRRPERAAGISRAAGQSGSNGPSSGIPIRLMSLLKTGKRVWGGHHS
jgi:hypothetical protein